MGVRYRAGVPPDHAGSLNPRRESAIGSPTRYRYDAVLFDFHGVLAQVEDPVRWVLSAASSVGLKLDLTRATALADRFVTAGRAGGPRPRRVPPQLAEVYANRDLYEYAFEAAYAGLLHSVDHGLPGADGLADALLQRVRSVDGWQLFADVVPVLRALRSAGVATGVVSNIGFDIRAILAQLGCADLICTWALSFEVGRTKPDPDIFRYACQQLAVDPARVLMVGHSAQDAAATEAGCSVLLLPAADPGGVIGLSAVLDLVGCAAR
jgi:FMN phosphatase YigB (HAD superfamily)